MGRVVSWTGHPFVDAGLAAIAAVAKVQDLAQLTPKHLEQAADELKRVLLSDQSLGVGVEKSFAKGALLNIFPNSELVNPSHWKGATPLQKVRQEYKDAVDKELRLAQRCLQFGSEVYDEVCSICGAGCTMDATYTVRKQHVPFLSSIVNFYPALSFGLRVCGLCAFAVRFLPMSVMHTGGFGRSLISKVRQRSTRQNPSKRNRSPLWFLHTQSLQLATRISQEYGWNHFNRLISGKEALDFYGGWETSGGSGAVLYLLCELITSFKSQIRCSYSCPTPTTAYLFCSPNKTDEVYIRVINIPNSIFIFLEKLISRSKSSLIRFQNELLKVHKDLEDDQREFRELFVQKVSEKILNSRSILIDCLSHQESRLLGGWEAHRLYLSEVLGMSQDKLTILEQLGIQIAQSSDAKKRINELRGARPNELYGILLRYVREGWLKHDEFYTLLPPNDYSASSEVRDILLAIAYEWEFCQSQGKPSPTQVGTIALTPDETLKRIQEVGEQLCQKLPNLSRWIGQLQTARSTDGIRRAYLSAVRSGAMGFAEFIFLAPLGDKRRVWLLRDYLLAFLFERARNELPKEELVTVDSEAETDIGGE